MPIEKHEIKVSTTGGDASATGSTVLALPLCELVAVYCDFHATAPASTDTTISSPGNPAALTLLTITNYAKDGWYYPTVQKDNNEGAAITGDYAQPVIHGNLSISLAGSNALTDALVATVYVRT